MKTELRDLRVVLFCLIFAFYGGAGFYYTAFYSGWGHSALGALPMGMGLGIVALFISAIVVSELSLQKTVWVLTGFVSLGVILSLALYLGSR